MIVGFGHSFSGQDAFRWTQSAGMVGLGDLPGGTFSSIALATSAHGAVIVGHGTTDAGSEAFIWDAVHGMRLFQSVFSAAGLTIVGFGTNPFGQTEAWRATLVPEPGTWAMLIAGMAALRLRRRITSRGGR